MSTQMVVANPLLNAPARRIAATAIENVHLAYYEKGGVRETADKLRKQVESASKHVFSIARYAAKAHPKSMDEASKLYVAMCEYAEQQYKQAHEVENLREALPTWATFKSNVLRGLRTGLNPLEYKSEAVFRSRTMEQVSRSRTREDDDENKPPGGAELRDEDAIAGMLESTSVPDTLKQLVSQVVFAAEVVNPRKIELAVDILREAWQKLGALTDKRKLR